MLGPMMGTGYEPDAARDARARILAFFRRHLHPAEVGPAATGQ